MNLLCLLRLISIIRLMGGKNEETDQLCFKISDFLLHPTGIKSYSHSKALRSFVDTQYIAYSILICANKIKRCMCAM